MKFTIRPVLVGAVLVAATALGAAPASATTFCVPGFHAACRNNGTNVAEPDLETAMTSDGSDGSADRVILAATTDTRPHSLNPTGSDPLTVTGAGTGKTFITSSASTNSFVVDLLDRPASISNLTIVIPSSFPDSGGNGAGLQAADSSFNRVNIESRNPDSNAATSMLGDNIFRDGRVYGTDGGSIERAFGVNDAKGPGVLKVIGTRIVKPLWGVEANTGKMRVELKASLISEPVAYAVRVDNGGRVGIENSVIESGGQSAISIRTSTAVDEPDAAVSVRSSTIVAGSGPSLPPIDVQIGPGLNAASASVNVTDSILRGFAATWDIDAPIGPGLGSASVTLTDSNFLDDGLPANSPSVDSSDAGNIDSDPRFTGPGDYRLKPGSPSIDVAGPGGPASDFTGRLRPLDGDGDGTAVRDQGAFEAPDTFGPRITSLRSKTLKRGAVRIGLRLSEPGRLVYSFKPAPKRSHGRKRRSVVIKRSGRRGVNVLKVNGRRLSRGLYRVRVTAIDRYGNRSIALLKARAAANFVPDN
jgi:hypothetical protein